jgi:hypothetical protein
LRTGLADLLVYDVPDEQAHDGTEGGDARVLQRLATERQSGQTEGDFPADLLSDGPFYNSAIWAKRFDRIHHSST